MDRKTAATGDREELTIEQEKCLAYAEEILDALLRFTSLPPEISRQNKEDQEAAALWRRDWIRRLSKVPAWKLNELSNFNSPWINDVWGFFESLKPPMYEKHEILSLPEPEVKRSIHKDCCKWVSRFTDFLEEKASMTKEEITVKTAQIKKEYTDTMSKKYPNYKWGW